MRRRAAAATPLPILISISLGYGPTAGGSEVVLRGSGFTGATGVTIGGAACTSVVVDSDTQITCDAPAGTSGAKDVVVTTPAGSSTLAGGYTYQAGPDLSGASLDVSAGPWVGGTGVVVTGAARIEEGATATLGGVAHPITRISSTSFSFVTRAVLVSAAGAKTLTVTNPDGQSGSKNSAFTYSIQNTIPQYSDGATMDAAVSGGDVVELIGSTTGARIALLECATVGPVTYYTRSPIFLRESTGDEFTGVVSFEALGTGSIPSWASSTPGSTTVGGPMLDGTGTCKLNGLAFVVGNYNPCLKCEGYLDTRSGGTTNDLIGVGFVSDADDASISCGGLGKSAGGWANWSVGDGAVNAPAPAFNANYSAQPDEDERWDLSCLLHQYGANQCQISAGAQNAGQYAVRASASDAANGHVQDTDLQPGFSKVGTWVYHINVLHFDNG